MVPKCLARRHPEAPRFHQRGEGSHADYSRPDNAVETPPAKSARLNNAVLRRDACDGMGR
jgi:hypothetical protein